LFCSHIFSQDLTPIWQVALPGEVVSTPVERKNSELILICEDRRLYSINIKNGNINWKVKPGGKLSELYLSPDGSIITRDNRALYSYYGDGTLRWSLDFKEGITSNLTLNKRGDIFLVSNMQIFQISRFGIKHSVLNNVHTKKLEAISNSLILYIENNKLYSITFGGVSAFNFNLKESPKMITSDDDFFYLVFKEGTISKFKNSGEFVETWESKINNPTMVGFNHRGELVLTGDGISSIFKNSYTFETSGDKSLLFSNGFLVYGNEKWILSSYHLGLNIEYYPSGKMQVNDRSISLSDKKVWNDSKLRSYYRNMILSGNRKVQLGVLKELKLKVGDADILDQYPNFYEILLLASSNVDIKHDVRKEAYKVIALSKDLSFLPYLLNDLKSEDSYIILPYIFYALGQLAADMDGDVVSLISDRIDDYFDETLAINGLYALYYINNYTNGEYVDIVFSGIEKILANGYSNSIDERCYDIIDRIK